MGVICKMGWDLGIWDGLEHYGPLQETVSPLSITRTPRDLWLDGDARVVEMRSGSRRLE